MKGEVQREFWTTTALNRGAGDDVARPITRNHKMAYNARPPSRLLLLFFTLVRVVAILAHMFPTALRPSPMAFDPLKAHVVTLARAILEQLFGSVRAILVISRTWLSRFAINFFSKLVVPFFALAHFRSIITDLVLSVPSLPGEGTKKYEVRVVSVHTDLYLIREMLPMHLVVHINKGKNQGSSGRVLHMPQKYVEGFVSHLPGGRCQPHNAIDCLLDKLEKDAVRCQA